MLCKYCTRSGNDVPAGKFNFKHLQYNFVIFRKDHEYACSVCVQEDIVSMFERNKRFLLLENGAGEQDKNQIKINWPYYFLKCPSAEKRNGEDGLNLVLLGLGVFSPMSEGGWIVRRKNINVITGVEGGLFESKQVDPVVTPKNLCLMRREDAEVFANMLNTSNDASVMVANLFQSSLELWKI